MGQYDYEKTILGYLENLRAQLIARPLNLGGVTASGGGAGGPPGGFVGQLSQTRVTYDLSEAATLSTPVSGMSLVDNLNHIRYRINLLESNPASPLIVEQNGAVIASGVTVLDFLNSTVTQTSPGHVTILSAGGGGGGESVSHIYNETVSGTTHFDTAQTFNTGTLRVYYNGIKQDDSYFTADVDRQGFTTTFSAVAGDEVFVDYDIPGSGGSSTTGSGGHIIQDEGVSLLQRSKLNFIGSSVTVTDDSANDRTNVTITGGGDGGVTWDDYTTVGSGGTINSSPATAYRKMVAEIQLSFPIKISRIDWYVRTSGTYNLSLMTGPNNTDITLATISAFAVNEVVPDATAYHTFNISPTCTLYPGTYFIELYCVPGTTQWSYITSTNYGNAVFNNAAGWVTTSRGSLSAPIDIWAYKGHF